jgi:hypothetical protein
MRRKRQAINVNHGNTRHNFDEATGLQLPELSGRNEAVPIGDRVDIVLVPQIVVSFRFRNFEESSRNFNGEEMPERRDV